MVVRSLKEGDEQVAEDACRLFGLEGEIDAGEFLSRPEALVLVAEDESCERSREVVIRDHWNPRSEIRFLLA